MKRRVIQQGNSTLTITLPRKWTQKFGIEAGDELQVEEQEKALFVSSDKAAPLHKTVLDIRGLNQPLLWRYLIAAYRGGYDCIEIRFDPDVTYLNIYTSYADFRKKVPLSSIEIIRDAVNGLIGMEITEHKKDSCIVRDLGGITDKEFDNAFRRIFFLIDGMGEDILHLATKGKESLLRAIDITDTTIDRFADYCLRVLNKKGYKNFRKTAVMYGIIVVLEYIGDEYKRVSHHLFFSQEKRGKYLLDVFEDTRNLFSLFHSTFYDFKREKLNQIYEETEKLKKKIESSKFNTYEWSIVHHLKKINRFITDLLQLKIELET